MLDFGKKIAKTVKKKLKKKKKKKKVTNLINVVNLDIKDVENQIKTTEDEFNLCKEGKIEFSKLHSSANRPLRKIGNLNSSTQFCPCCNLPAEQAQILVPYTFCESIDKYAESGQGIYLYFAFFKFSIVSLFICSLIIGLTNIYFNFECNNDLINFCNNYFKIKLIAKGDISFLDECKLYFTGIEKDSEYYTNFKNNDYFKFSTVNIKNYVKIFKKINKLLKHDIPFEKTIFNISLINYICLISIFILNLIYIYYIYNKNNSVNYQYLRQSDYSVFIYNLYDVHKRFLDIKKELDNKRLQSQKDGGTLDNCENDYKQKLGIDKSLSELKNESIEFEYFLKNKILIGENNESISIDNIVLCSKMDNYTKLEKNMEEIAQKINKIKFDDDVIDFNNDNNLTGDERKLVTAKFSFLCFSFCKKEEKLIDLKNQKEKIYKELDELYKDTKFKTSDYFAGCGFITFTNLKEKILFLKLFNYSFIKNVLQLFKDIIYMIFNFCLNIEQKPISWLRNYIKIEQADEPSDIIFENLSFSTLSKIIRTFLVYVVSFFFGIFSNSIFFVAIAGVNYLLDYINKKIHNQVIQYLTSFALSFISTFLNFIYENVFHILTRFEKQSTWTKYYLSYSIKLTTFSFINSGLMPLLGEISHPSDGHKTLINNMLMMFIINSIYTPIRWTLDLSFFKKKIQIWWLERKKDPDDEHGLTQKELNELYELPPMNIAIKYSYIVKTLLMAFLYIAIFPLGIVISFFGFCLAYLLEKFNFCKIYKKPEMLGSKICKFYINYFVIILFVYTIGDLFLLRNTFDTNIWTWVNLITFGTLIFIPYSKLLTIDYLKVNKYDLYTKEYKDCIDFTEDYERANPISQKEGKINYLKKLKDKGIILENDYQNYLKDIYNINIMQIYYKNENKEDLKKNKDENENIIIKQNINKNEDDKVNNEINVNNNKNIDLNNNASFSSNVKIDSAKKKLKKKKKPLIDNQLNLNKFNPFSSNDVFTNPDENKINQN